MKRIKKLLLLALACLTVCTVGAISACGGDENPNNGNGTQQGGNTGDETPDEPVEYVYKIRTQSEGGFGLKDVNVALYNGSEKLASVNTNADGNAFFTSEEIAQVGEYSIELTNVPKGWNVKDDSISYQTSTVSGSNVNINFSASLITDEEVPETKMYRLGDVMYDFSLTDSAGDTYKLSELLKEKKMVLLNFWATYCGPCASEFPVMNQAYELYKSDVEILAVSSYEPDTQSVVENYKNGKSLTFPMSGVPNSSVITSHFSTSAIPVSVVIDRYGVVSYIHTGSMVALTDFATLFDKFVGDNYVQTVIDSESSEGGDTGVLEWAKPDVSKPNLDEVKAAFSGSDSAFTYSWEDDEYSWPWQIGSDTNGSYLAASNKQVDYSYSTVNIDFTAEANTALAFDYALSTESKADYLYVMLDGTIIHSLSGLQEDWTTCYAYVFNAEHAGAHRLSLVYMKDASISGDDNVFVKNLRFVNLSEIPEEGLDLNIVRHAATEWNNPADYQDGDSKTAKFDKYANVKLGADGYYHVIPDNAEANYEVNLDTDPLLFADIMNGTRWNKYDLWQLAYNGVLVYNGFDLEEAVESFAWAANESTNGFVPVTPALKELLQHITKLNVVGEAKDENDNASRVNYFDENCHVDYHENEWLEFCLYYDHYGDTPQMSDPTRGITYEGAIEIYEGTTTINCFKSMVPVGIKHKFTPLKSGVYHFYSNVDPKHFDTGESYNPQMWLVDSDKTTFLAYNEDFLIHHTGNPENFDVKYYLEAGKTYYCLFAFFLNATGEFELHIDYKGNYYENLTNCAIGPYTMNLVTSETYVPGTQNILYDETNDVYRVANKDGVFLGDIYDGLDDKVYWDLTNPTPLFSLYTLKSYIDTYTKYDEDKRLFYLPDENGDKKDYSAIMADYLFEAELNNYELNGKIAVNAELMHIMLELTKAHDGFGGVKNSWQMMCYYYQPLGQQ
ncbi:MAG: redoxin domain-containing protein [Clostridia bacterium]|nr:redoxin domain-containing protein [Clostridia bacterium]